MLKKSTIQLLRFHFSLFLLPVYLFAVSQVEQVDWFNAVAVFIILHLLVYPSSNGYNSFMDKDETPIGGLATPMQPTKQLFYTSVVMDVVAVVASLFINPIFAVGVLLYIAASRLYSYRKIRLKQYPYIGFLTVFFFQGAVTFYITYVAVSATQNLNVPLLPSAISSCLIGALYPLTQIYQHIEDKKDGVTTISYVLGKKGSFVFSALLFVFATLFLYVHFQEQNNQLFFWAFVVITAPVVLFFLYWMSRVWKNEEAANFKNSLSMNIIATLCTTLFFIYLIVQNH